MNKKQEAAAIKALKARGYKVEKSVEPPQFGDILDIGGPVLICWYDDQAFNDANLPEAKFYRWGGVDLSEQNAWEPIWLDIREWEAWKAKKLGHVDISKWMKK